MLHDCAPATAGAYRQQHEGTGKKMTRPGDVRTGLPVRHGAVSIIVRHPEGEMADVRATALNITG